MEKQKLCFFYHLSDKQFRRYMAEASRTRSNTVDKLNELLERRLDNVIRRASFGTDHLADPPARHARPHAGERPAAWTGPRTRCVPETSSACAPKSKKAVTAIIEAGDVGAIVPGWLTANTGDLTVKVERLPAHEEIFRPFETNMQHVVEFIR